MFANIIFTIRHNYQTSFEMSKLIHGSLDTKVLFLLHILFVAVILIIYPEGLQFNREHFASPPPNSLSDPSALNWTYFHVVGGTEMSLS